MTGPRQVPTGLPATRTGPPPGTRTDPRAGAHGEPVRRTGMVAAVRLSPGGESPRFEVDLVTRAPRPGRISTGGERIRLVWIGQRGVPGITAGRWLAVEGFLAEHAGIPTVYNPRYELLAGAPHEHRT